MGSPRGGVCSPLRRVTLRRMRIQQWVVESSYDGVSWTRADRRFRSRALADGYAEHNLPRSGVKIRVVAVLEPPDIRADSISPLLSRR